MSRESVAFVTLSGETNNPTFCHSATTCLTTLQVHFSSMEFNV